jgi:hypothetical protein
MIIKGRKKMNSIKILMVLGTCLWLSGCIFDPIGGGWDDGPRHHHRDYDRGYDDGGGRGNGFCPPGQAKKGNC